MLVIEKQCLEDPGRRRAIFGQLGGVKCPEGTVQSCFQENMLDVHFKEVSCGGSLDTMIDKGGSSCGTHVHVQI